MATIELSGNDKKIKQLRKELKLRCKKDNIILKEVEPEVIESEPEVKKPAKKKKADKPE